MSKAINASFGSYSMNFLQLVQKTLIQLNGWSMLRHQLVLFSSLASYCNLIGQEDQFRRTACFNKINRSTIHVRKTKKATNREQYTDCDEHIREKNGPLGGEVDNLLKGSAEAASMDIGEAILTSCSVAPISSLSSLLTVHKC
jgi:hypothetical protein